MAATGQVTQYSEEYAYDLPYAPMSLRLVAFILDLVVTVSIFLTFVTLAGIQLLARSDWGANSDPPEEVYYASALIMASFFIFVPWLYAALWWWRGQSIGQMAVHIAVTDRDGEHLTFWQAVVRVIFWPIAVLSLVGLLPIFFDRESRGLHDMVAGTVVVELP
jgi:uncharacterized RDD family membrane protein YckC